MSILRARGGLECFSAMSLWGTFTYNCIAISHFSSVSVRENVVYTIEVKAAFLYKQSFSSVSAMENIHCTRAALRCFLFFIGDSEGKRALCLLGWSCCRIHVSFFLGDSDGKQPLYFKLKACSYRFADFPSVTPRETRLMPFRLKPCSYICIVFPRWQRWRTALDIL